MYFYAFRVLRLSATKSRSTFIITVFGKLCRITVTFVDKDGEEKVIQVPMGMSMLEAAHENDIELEGFSLVISRQYIRFL